MADRRPLTEGLKPQTPVPTVDARIEREFVHGNKPVAAPPSPAPANPYTRVSFTTRIYAEYSQALKKASLERQLQGVEPNSVQAMLEEALEAWLRSNGYIR